MIGIRAFLVSAALVSSATLAAAAACARRVPRTHEVAIRDFTFQPETLTAAAGDTIVWTNLDFVPHTVTARRTEWDSEGLDAGSTWSLVARTAGEHAYYCVLHPNMQGVIEVR